MAIAQRNIRTTGSATNGGNITLSMPTGTAENDVVIVMYAMNAAGTGGTSSPGWTQIGANVTNTVRIQVFRKVMGASPDASIVLTGTAGAADSSSAIAHGFSGVDTTTPEDVALVSATGTSTNPDCPSATPVTTGAIAIAFAAGSAIDTTGTGGPSGYTNFTNISSNDNNDTTSYEAWKNSPLTAGTPEDPSAFTGVTSTAWAAYTIILRPDQSATGTAAQTITKAAQAASGTEEFTGTGASTETVASQSAAGTVATPVTGTSDQAITKTAQAATGTETFTGSAAQTAIIATQAASGSEAFTGTAAQTSAVASQSADGTAAEGDAVTGTAEQTTIAASQSADGTVADSDPAAAEINRGGSGVSPAYMRRLRKAQREEEERRRKIEARAKALEQTIAEAYAKATGKEARKTLVAVAEAQPIPTNPADMAALARKVADVLSPQTDNETQRLVARLERDLKEVIQLIEYERVTRLIADEDAAVMLLLL